MALVNTGAGYKVDLDISFEPPTYLLAQEISFFAGTIRSFREPLERSVREVVGPSIRENFDVGGRPPWAPLSERTLLIKSQIGAPDDPLIRTGLLRRVAGQLNTWYFGQTEAFVTQFKGAEYGAFHETGTKYMPARPFMTIQPEDRDKIESVFERWLTERAIAAGFLP